MRVLVSIPAGQVYRGVMNPSCGSLVWNPYKTLRPFLLLQAVRGEKPAGSGATKGDRARAAEALRQSFESTLEASCMRVKETLGDQTKALPYPLSLGRVSQNHLDPRTLRWPGQGI